MPLCCPIAQKVLLVQCILRQLRQIEYFHCLKHHFQEQQDASYTSRLFGSIIDVTVQWATLSTVMCRSCIVLLMSTFFWYQNNGILKKNNEKLYRNNALK